MSGHYRDRGRGRGSSGRGRNNPRAHLGAGAGASEAFQGSRQRDSRQNQRDSSVTGSRGGRRRSSSGLFSETGDDRENFSLTRANGRGRGRFRGRDNESKQEKTHKSMTYTRLKLWSESEDAGQLVLFMSNERLQLEEFLNQKTIKEDWLMLFLRAVNHAITAQHQREAIKQILEILCKTRFLDEHLIMYTTDKQMRGTWSEADEFFNSMVKVLNEILVKLPSFAYKCIASTSQLLNTISTLDNMEDNLNLLQSMKALLSKAKEIYTLEKENEKEKKGARLCKVNDLGTPPDDFTKLPVVPTAMDLSENASSFIRSAKIEGTYDDVQHYLDVQFRLMRQDFILPLRQGIVEFKNSGCKKDFKCSDLRLYYDVHIAGQVFKDGIDHVLQFDISKLKSIRWEFSKRLIFGSLICLSKDNFETVLFATVAHRDPKQLKDGYINVNFKSGFDIVFNSTPHDTFIMAETTAYFESYCHVLEGLQEMSGMLPLQQYIIKCEKVLKPPRYLLPSGGVVKLPVYDLSALLTQEASQHSFPVLTTIRWPKADAMCLNESQREAAQLALTKEMAIIQGPPGTGKTYVGLKVMQILLENQHVMADNEENKNDPILVVCYTNHALDQFLEGILEFCEGIIRVGGKNSSERLEPYNLKNVRRTKTNLLSDRSARTAKYRCLDELKMLSDEIRKKNDTMGKLDTDLVSEDILESFMSDNHFTSLKRQNPGLGHHKSQMRQWLNASQSNPQSVLPKMIKQCLCSLILQWNDKPVFVKLSENMDIRQRAIFYQQMRLSIRDSLRQEEEVTVSANRVNEIRQYISDLESNILSDDDLQICFPNYMNKICTFMQKTHRLVSFEPGKIFEAWLLGLHRSLHAQLDDIQALTTYLKREQEDTFVFDDSDVSKQEDNKRIVDDEDDDDDDEATYAQKTEIAKNSFASVLQRAEMLGIREDQDDKDSSDGWTTVHHSKPLSFTQIRKKLVSVKPMTEEEEKTIDDVWTLDLNKRFALYNLWVKRYKVALTEKMETLTESYLSVYYKKQEINREETLYFLRKAKVIGMTTTGAAKHRAVLQSVGCRIIVVEEAAEVLESHIVTALNKQCNHLILIGDHQQLRPSPTVYQLAKEFGLEISLFERLIKNKVPHVVLKEQHRMRPQIANLMRHIYPDLQDHHSVKDYSHIRGVAKDIFLINHQEKESQVDDTRSKANIHEAKFVVALCTYLLLQGYEESQVTILATYAGQILAIKKTMKEKNFTHRVRVTAVDNYQGEENKIIILSLVRSNENNNVGFLKVDNRVCVALSRAKEGLFIIGNFNLLSSQSKLWSRIIETAENADIIGEALPVICQNHPEFQQFITSEADFEKCPNGGCGRPCEYRLPCGHSCALTCHTYDPEHKNYECKKPCLKECKAGHKCKRKCFQDCGNCTEPVLKKIPVCGHLDSVKCHILPSKAVCSQKCQHMLDCEHQCQGMCGQCRKTGAHPKCMKVVERSWPCGHTSQVPCYRHPSEYPCPKPCDAILDCGHKCSGKCSDCLNGAVHKACAVKCKKALPCGHQCQSYCSVPCLPCSLPCPVQCRHSACSTQKKINPCGNACHLCKESCMFKCNCKDRKCTKICHEMCDFTVCNKKCKKKCTNSKHSCTKKCGKDCPKERKCEEACSGLCGELCVCASCDKIFDVQVKSNQGSTEGSLVKPTSSSEERNDNTGQSAGIKSKRLLLKIPSCRHVFHVDELDRYVHNFDPDGSSFIGCPACMKPIMNCMRYENVNKERHVKREEMKKELMRNAEILPYHRENLEMSKRRLEDSILLISFNLMDPREITNKTEMKALSFQLKCAFVLGEISSIRQSKVSEDQDLKERKDALLMVNGRLTGQLKQEFTDELLRLLRLSHLNQLDEVCELHDISLPENLRAEVTKTKESLRQVRPTKNYLERGQFVNETLSRRIKEFATETMVKAKCHLMEQASARATRILLSKDDEMLSDLIEKKQSTGVPVFSSVRPKTVKVSPSRPIPLRRRNSPHLEVGRERLREEGRKIPPEELLAETIIHRRASNVSKYDDLDSDSSD